MLAINYFDPSHKTTVSDVLLAMSRMYLCRLWWGVPQVFEKTALVIVKREVNFCFIYHWIVAIRPIGITCVVRFWHDGRCFCDSPLAGVRTVVPWWLFRFSTSLSLEFRCLLDISCRFTCLLVEVVGVSHIGIILSSLSRVLWSMVGHIRPRPNPS